SALLQPEVLRSDIHWFCSKVSIAQLHKLFQGSHRLCRAYLSAGKAWRVMYRQTWYFAGCHTRMTTKCLSGMLLPLSENYADAEKVNRYRPKLLPDGHNLRFSERRTVPD